MEILVYRGTIDKLEDLPKKSNDGDYYFIYTSEVCYIFMEGDWYPYNYHLDFHPEKVFRKIRKIKKIRELKKYFDGI